MSHAEATFRAVDPLAVAVIEPAFRAALMLGGRPPPLEALRGLAADRPTVGLPPPAGPTDGEHRPAPRPAAAHRAPPRGSGAHAGPPRRRRRVRRRRDGTGEIDRPAWEDGGASPGGLRSRAHGARRRRDRTRSRPSGRARVGVTRSAREGVASGHGGCRGDAAAGGAPAFRTQPLARPRSARSPVPSTSSASPIAPATGNAGTGSGPRWCAGVI